MNVERRDLLLGPGALAALYPGVKRIDAAERARQLAERQALSEQRFVDS